ncbi:C6 zinc finger domain-containing protein [Phlyctema vagabunda]|uniref:C6 zinc finger domain-containing protein n=1 Tax=Phlyctema vagabunda TaxID=108571 RepID=A0ABR4P986_9HELO
MDETCDESKPVCKNCVHYGEDCEYVPAKPRGSGASASKIPASVSSHFTNSAAPSPRPFQDTLNSTHDFSIGSSRDLNLAHLELLHHFCIATSATLHHDPKLKLLWKTTVVQLGVADDYVMHGILAIAALHLAYLLPAQRDYYLSQAMDHHRIGLDIATENMLHVTDQNCSSLYIFSVLAFMFSLAGPRTDGDCFLVGHAGLSEWLVLLRGSGHILHFARDTLLAGPLGPIFITGRRRNDSRNDILKASCEEARQIQELSDAIDASTLDLGARRAYSTAFTQLRRIYAIVYSDSPESRKLEPGDVFAWVFRVPEEYILLLKEQTPQSLAILAYFAVLIKTLEDQWWLDGLSSHLISRISFLCGDEHREWIAWPLQFIGWSEANMSPSPNFLNFDAITPFSNVSGSTY